MKRFLKVTGIIAGLLITGILLTAAYVKIALPDVGKAPELKIERTPERIANGKYLAHHVAVCMDCHSTRNWEAFAGPITNENLGAGGEFFGKDLGFPGEFYSRNITPHGLGSWTDGEIFRAVTMGVNKNGKALFPVMPYHNYGRMDKEDIYDIIAYLRTLPSVAREVPESKADFPMNLIINTLPQKQEPVAKPFKTDKVPYGKYLVMTSGCMDCHSQEDKGKLIAGTEFGGGRVFKMPAGSVTSSNITPDVETGIGNWDQATFIQRFKQYTDSNYRSPVLTKNDINTPMPWTMYAGMELADLEAIYSYLSSLQPIRNTVVRYQKNKL